MRNFFLRTRTALVFVAVMVGGIYWNIYSYALLLSIIIFFCLYEYYTLMSYMREENRVSRFYLPAGIFSGLLVFFISLLVLTGHAPQMLYVIPVCLILSFFALEIFSGSMRPFENVAQNITGIIYVSIPFAILNHVTIIDGVFNPKAALGILFMVWVNDAAAYIFGSLFGNRKLIPRISPGKTIEGLFGALFMCLVLAYLLFIVSEIFFPDDVFIIPLKGWFVIAVIVWVTATFGDLIVSMFKRSIGIKDTGHFFPGHGGFLDRFDAFIFAVPFAAAYLLWLKYTMVVCN